MTTIILADDHKLVRESIALLLGSIPNFNVVSQCRDGRQLIKIVNRFRPDVAVVDISMAELNGIDAARQIRKISPRTRIIALTAHTEETYIREMLNAGISGYVVKCSAAQDLVDAIRCGTRGKVYFSEEITDVAERFQTGGKWQSAGAADRPLTQREREILQLIGEGFSSNEIARKLEIGETTVKTHRNNLMNKLNVRDVAGLTRHAIRLKLVYIE